MRNFNDFYLEAIKENISKKMVLMGINEHDIRKFNFAVVSESAFNENIFRKGMDWLMGRVIGKSSNINALAQQVKQVKASLNAFQQSMQRLGVPAEEVMDVFQNMNTSVDNLYQQASQAQGQGGQQQQPQDPYDGSTPPEQSAPAAPQSGSAATMARLMPKLLQQAGLTDATKFAKLPDQQKLDVANKYLALPKAQRAAYLQKQVQYLNKLQAAKAPAPAPAPAPKAPAPKAPAPAPKA
jgi:hypothetical protein